MKLSVACIALSVVASLGSVSALAKKDTKAASATSSSTASSTASSTVELDPAASKITWNGKKVTGEHKGEIKLKDGSFVVKNKAVVSGKAALEMASITDLDLKDAENNAKLLGHLKSEDFFDTAKYPLATFVLKSVVPKAGANGTTDEMTGDLTIKGETHPITFPAKIVEAAGKYTADAHVVVDRTIWNIKYGSGKFFTGLGDKVIRDEFTLDLKLVSK